MAKNRMINTKFWSDGWIINLDPLERYLYLYFLTNEHTNICGIYELPLKIMARESGIDEEMLSRMIKKMSDKILYFNGWIYIKNFIKHQKTSGNVKLGIENGLKEIPNEIMSKFNKELDTPPCVIDKPSHSLKLELESELESEFEFEPKVLSDKSDEQLNQDVKAIIDYWFVKWQKVFNQKPQVAGAKFTVVAKPIIKTHGIEKAKKVCDVYFSTDDDFFRKQAWGFMTMMSSEVFNSLLTKI